MLTRIRLTLKQNRFETIAVAVVCLGLTAAALVEAWRLNSLNVPFSCFQNYSGPYFPGSGQPVPTAAQLRCNDLVQSFQSLQQSTDVNLVRMLLWFVPLVAGLIYGAPLVAREIEQGTAPLSWALSGSRRRWLLGKVLTGVLLIVPLMLAVGLVSDVLQGALSPHLHTHAAFENYAGRGVMVVFWALAAYAGTLALGTILGRTMPAVILALVICFFVRATWEPGMNHFVLTPLAVNAGDRSQMYSSYYTGLVDMPLYQKVYIDGKEVTNDQANAWYMANLGPVQIVTPDPSGALPTGPAGSDGKGVVSQGPTIDQSHFPKYIDFVIPGSMYWPVVALESGFLLLGTLFCGGIAMAWVDRRRPY
jgi:hypothetical protein